MSEKIKILIVGNAYDSHLYRLINKLLENTDSIIIDFYSYTKKENQIPIVSNLCNKIFFRSQFFPSFCYKIPKLGTLLSIIDFKLTYKKNIVQSYDFINVSFVSIDNLLCSNIYRERTKVLLLSPWGSDVLRAPLFNRYLLKDIYYKADYISLPNIGFRDKVQSIFKIPESKIINMGFGSDMIDIIEKNQHLNKKEAKNKLGLGNKYIITIGYNGSKAQNHIKVINQINMVKKSLPENLFLLLPMTYPSDNYEYINLVKGKLEEYKLPYIIYDSFLPNDVLLLLRKCTDIFIHAQNTDASSASLQEYLLTDSIVLNASWLKYPQFEKYGKPYFTFDSINEISETLLSINENKKSIEISSSLKVDLFNNGWNKAIKPWTDFYTNLKK